MDAIIPLFLSGTWKAVFKKIWRKKIKRVIIWTAKKNFTKKLYRLIYTKGE